MTVRPTRMLLALPLVLTHRWNMALTSVIIQSPSSPSAYAIQPGVDTGVPDTMSVAAGADPMSVRRMDLLALALALSAG